jgi:hypothetical protein
MATEIRNVSVEPLTLPSPLRGALKGGQAIVLSLTPAELLSVAPSVSRAFQILDLGAGYAGATDDASYGANDDLDVDSVTASSVFAVRVKGRSGSLLLQPNASGGAVGIMKADGSTYAFQSDATGTAVNGATPVARAAAITSPTAPGASYVQAEAAAMKTAVDAIRVALANFGIIS